MKNIAFVSNDKPHIFASKISALVKMKEDISQNLVNQCQYQIKSDVKDEDIDIFINYLLNDEVPKIITNGFRLLSSEILKEDNFTLIKQLNDPGVEDKTNIIKEISEKLDNILLFYGEELLKCPIQILRLIFDGANLKNHEFAYQLIVSHADKTQNNDIFILLPYINYKKIQVLSALRKEMKEEIGCQVLLHHFLKILKTIKKML